MKFYLRTQNIKNNIESAEKKLINTPKHSPKKMYPKNKKIDFLALKKNTIKSLNDVECFLSNFQNFCKYVKLYKILR